MGDGASHESTRSYGATAGRPSACCIASRFVDNDAMVRGILMAQPFSHPQFSRRLAIQAGGIGLLGLRIAFGAVPPIS